MDSEDENLAVLTDHEGEVWPIVTPHLQSAVAVTCSLTLTL